MELEFKHRIQHCGMLRGHLRTSGGGAALATATLAVATLRLATTAAAVPLAAASGRTGGVRPWYNT